LLNVLRGKMIVSIIVRVLCILHLLPFSQGKQVVFGKYYWKDKVTGATDNTDNSYFVYKPPVNIAAPAQPRGFPVVFQAYGTFWTRPGNKPEGPFKKANPAVALYNSWGIAFVSTGYRGTSSKYWYDEAGTTKREELINVDAEGRLSLDSTGLTMGDYKVRATALELVTKCIYDVVQSLEKLISNAGLHGIDINRIFFTSSSAGSVEVNYLTWVYHKWNKERYTPLGMAMLNPQFDLPMMTVNEHVMNQWIEHSDAGPNTLASELWQATSCMDMIGNMHCEPVLHRELDGTPETCNRTFHTEALQRYCAAPPYGSSPQFPTIGEVAQTQRYEVSAGMKKLWYTSQNMLDYHPVLPGGKLFNLYTASDQNGVFHGSAFLYGEMAARIGIDYTAYYLPQPGLRKTAVPSYAAQPEVNFQTFLVRSTIDWISLKPPRMGPFSPEEHLLFVCHVFGLQCGTEMAASRLLRDSIILQ